MKKIQVLDYNYSAYKSFLRSFIFNKISERDATMSENKILVFRCLNKAKGSRFSYEKRGWIKQGNVI